MNEKLLSGEEALAVGAICSNLDLATGYPGSPGTTVMDYLLEEATNHDTIVEWSVNEKVAAETAIGVSIAGGRALVCVKNVGLNAMIDPLMALNLTPVNGGLVFIIGDDPGGYGSQNDQDSRPLVNLLEMPWLEPFNPSHGLDVVMRCFDLSEKFKTPFFVRITRAYSGMSEDVRLPVVKPRRTNNVDLTSIDDRFVPQPSNAVKKHRDLHDRLHAISTALCKDGYPIEGRGKPVIVASGHMTTKLHDVLEGSDWRASFSLLSLEVIYPINEEKIFKLIAEADKVVILEEHHPVVENQIRQIAQKHNTQTEIISLSSSLEPAGEFFRWQIAKVLRDQFPGIVISSLYSEERELEELPKMISHCTDCRYDEVLNALDAICDKSGIRPFYIGDPGCLVTVADRIHAKYAMGGAVATASGFSRITSDFTPIAFFGDSSLFHSTLPALTEICHRGLNLLCVLLDNGSALTTGGQLHPGSPQHTNRLSVEKIALGCGVKHYFEYELDLMSQIDPELFKLKGVTFLRIIIN